MNPPGSCPERNNSACQRVGQNRTCHRRVCPENRQFALLCRDEPVPRAKAHEGVSAAELPLRVSQKLQRVAFRPDCPACACPQKWDRWPDRYLRSPRQAFPHPQVSRVFFLRLESADCPWWGKGG